MAEPALPPKPETKQRLQNEGAKHDNAQILLPAQSPGIPPRRSPPASSMVGTGPRAESPIAPPPASSPVLRPLPKPAAVPPSAPHLLPRVQAPQEFGDVPVQPSPKKETARIAILQRPSPSPSPAIVPPAPGLAATSKAIDAFDSIPRWFCWGLLGLSALIFLTQIWNYALS